MTASQSQPRLPLHTWLGLTLLLVGQLLLRLGLDWMATWLTPVMWTGLILFVDGLVYRLRGHSWLTTRRREFPLLLLLSVGVWLVFEAYNLHLRNWQYVGLPPNPIVRDLGYFWSFATIMPGVFEVSGLIQAALQRVRVLEPRSGRGQLGPRWAWSLAGIAMLALPLALPAEWAAFLFGSVWIGFFLLLDPLNQRLGLASIRGLWRAGDRRPVLALLLGGFICGLLWEGWNQQAAASGGAFWVYTFPDQLRPLDLRYGQMPVLGLLGFLPFALELFAFYQLLKESLGGDRVFGRAHSPGSV